MGQRNSGEARDGEKSKDWKLQQEQWEKREREVAEALRKQQAEEQAAE